MNILYVNPSRIEAGLDAVMRSPPLCLLSIAGMVPDHGAKLLDFKVDKFREDVFRRDLNGVDVVAITGMTPQIFHAFEVAQIAKEQGCITIVGGYQATLDPNFVAKHPAVDYTVRGEGEHTFKELIDYLDGNKHNVNLKDIDGISYKRVDGHIIHNNDRQLEKNLDNFAMPRRDLLKGKIYRQIGARLDVMETSRGCPHDCKFCCIIKMWKDPVQKISYRTKSIPRIMREIYDVDWKCDFVSMCDDNFSINVKRTEKLLDTIIYSGVPNKLHFGAQSRVDTLYRNPGLIDKLDRAGFRHIFLGIETVHQQSLNAMNKRNLTPAMVKHVVKTLRDRGISIFGGVIIGFPGETAAMVRQTIMYAKSLELDVVQFTPITAFPGTPFFEENKQNGRITTYDYRRYNLFQPMMRTDQLSTNELYKLVAEAYASFYLSGKWFKKKMREYLNPFGRFNWMLKRIPNLAAQMVFGGIRMFHSQGMSGHMVSDEMKYYISHPEIIQDIIEGKAGKISVDKEIINNFVKDETTNVHANIAKS